MNPELKPASTATSSPPSPTASPSVLAEKPKPNTFEPEDILLHIEKDFPEKSLIKSKESPEVKPASTATSSPLCPTASPMVLDPTSPPTDLNAAEKPKPNIFGPYVTKVGWTEEDLLLSVEERANKCWKDYFAEKKKNPPTRKVAPRVIPPEPLPKGWAWGSYIPGSGKKQFAYKIMCLNCGKGCDHLTDDCPDIDTPEAVRFREATFTIRGVSSSTHVPENK